MILPTNNCLLGKSSHLPELSAWDTTQNLNTLIKMGCINDYIGDYGDIKGDTKRLDHGSHRV